MLTAAGLPPGWRSLQKYGKTRARRPSGWIRLRCLDARAPAMARRRPPLQSLHARPPARIRGWIGSESPRARPGSPWIRGRISGSPSSTAQGRAPAAPAPLGPSPLRRAWARIMPIRLARRAITPSTALQLDHDMESQFSGVKADQSSVMSAFAEYFRHVGL